MLILTRRKRESIYIGDTVKIKVRSIEGDLVTFEVLTPKGLQVTLDDIKKKIRRTEG